MKNSKKILSIVVLTIMLTSMMFLTATVTVKADIIQFDTYAVIMPTPETVGVGQNIMVSMRIDKMGVGTTIRANLFTGYTVKITLPDGTIENKGPFTADATSGAWFLYAPSKVGIYKFQFSFPGMWINTTATQRFYKPSISAIAQVTVQEQPIQGYPDVPIPTDYWTRPVYAENKNWWQIADSWLMGTRNRYDGRFSPYSAAPDSPHILWNKPLWFGGIAGGQFGDKTFYTGLTYEQPYEPVIIGGRIYYVVHGPTSTAGYGTRCLDLYTGEEIWYIENMTAPIGQVLDIETANEHGLLPYLWSTSGSGTNATWRMYDAFEGRLITTITNVTSGTTNYGPNGELLSYSFSGSGTTRRLMMFNSTLAITGRVNDYFSPALGSIFDGRNGLEWNVSVPDVGVTQSILAIGEGYLLARYSGTQSYPQIFTDMAYDLSQMKIDSSGNYPTILSQLWLKNRTDLYTPSQRPINIGNGVYPFFSSDTAQIHCYSIKTGEQKWVSDPLPGWGIFNVLSYVAYNKVYYTGYDGHVRAYDVDSGKLMWDFYFGSSGYENAYGTWPVNNGLTIADGKIFVTNDEHTPDPILWRGGKLACLDAETGVCLWNITGWKRLPAISDGILTTVDSYDGQLYAIGKGPSATTISISQNPVTKGSATMILGTVTDQSPGAKGTAAVSEKNMAEWMAYLYMQKPKPANVQGVQVTLTAIDPNGNTQNIGTATSNIAGTYGLMWTPPVEGQYTITATFAGTNSYGSSYAMTYLGVGPAPSPAATNPPTPTPTQTVAPTVAPTATASPSPVPNTGAGLGTEVYIAIAAAVVIAIVAAAALVLRKRK
jgi:hypothetical protein